MGAAAAELVVPLFHSLDDSWLFVSLPQRPRKSKLMLPSLGNRGAASRGPRATSHGLTLSVISLLFTFHLGDPFLARQASGFGGP